MSILMINSNLRSQRYYLPRLRLIFSQKLRDWKHIALTGFHLMQLLLREIPWPLATARSTSATIMVHQLSKFTWGYLYWTGARDVWHLLHQSTRAQNARGLRAINAMHPECAWYNITIITLSLAVLSAYNVCPGILIKCYNWLGSVYQLCISMWNFNNNHIVVNNSEWRERLGVKGQRFH